MDLYTVSRAVRSRRCLDPKYPLACFKTFRRLALDATTRLALGMNQPSIILSYFLSNVRGAHDWYQGAIMRFTRLLSTEATNPCLANLRLRDLLFFVSMWLAYALPRRIFPVPVLRKRLAAARFVLILGMVISRSFLFSG